MNTETNVSSPMETYLLFTQLISNLIISGSKFVYLNLVEFSFSSFFVFDFLFFSLGYIVWLISYDLARGGSSFSRLLSQQ